MPWNNHDYLLHGTNTLNITEVRMNSHPAGIAYSLIHGIANSANKKESTSFHFQFGKKNKHNKIKGKLTFFWCSELAMKSSHEPAKVNFCKKL